MKRFAFGWSLGRGLGQAGPQRLCDRISRSESADPVRSHRIRLIFCSRRHGPGLAGEGGVCSPDRQSSPSDPIPESVRRPREPSESREKGPRKACRASLPPPGQEGTSASAADLGGHGAGVRGGAHHRTTALSSNHLSGCAGCRPDHSTQRRAPPLHSTPHRTRFGHLPAANLVSRSPALILLSHVLTSDDSEARRGARRGQARPGGEGWRSAGKLNQSITR